MNGLLLRIVLMQNQSTFHIDVKVNDYQMVNVLLLGESDARTP